MISESERVLLKQLISSPQGRVLESLIEEKKKKYRDDFGGRDTEWETIKATLINEGKIRGLNELYQEIFNQASK